MKWCVYMRAVVRTHMNCRQIIDFPFFHGFKHIFLWCWVTRIHLTTENFLGNIIDFHCLSASVNSTLRHSIYHNKSKTSILIIRLLTTNQLKAFSCLHIKNSPAEINRAVCMWFTVRASAWLPSRGQSPSGGRWRTDRYPPPASACAGSGCRCDHRSCYREYGKYHAPYHE